MMSYTSLHTWPESCSIEIMLSFTLLHKWRRICRKAAKWQFIYLVGLRQDGSNNVTPYLVGILKKPFETGRINAVWKHCCYSNPYIPGKLKTMLSHFTYLLGVFQQDSNAVIHTLTYLVGKLLSHCHLYGSQTILHLRLIVIRTLGMK